MDTTQRSIIFTIVLLYWFQCILSASSSFFAPMANAMREATSAPPISYYDYIIVGGGTAGCPLASTLSKGAKVLLLERGGSPYGDPNITRKENFGKPMTDPSPESPAQRFRSTDGVVNARGRVLGGSSCLNAGFFTRAQAQFVRDAKWDESLVLESYRWVEKQVAFWPRADSWQGAVARGLVEAGVTPYNGYTFEHIVGTKIGGSIFDHNDYRHTAADLLTTANPKTLTVLLHAVVEKLLFDNEGTDKPVAKGVAYVDSAGEAHRAYLKEGPHNAVIVSAGALGSPQLLMLSGIGPKSHLQTKKIPVVLDQPMVGQVMSDNPMNAVFVPSPGPLEFTLIETVGIASFGSFIEASGGASRFSDLVSPRGFGMFSPRIGQLATVPPKERTEEAFIRAIEQMELQTEEAYLGGIILEKVDGPRSKGHLELETLNVRDNPSVTFNYFSDPEDLRVCVKGLQVIQKVINSRAFAPFYDKDSNMTNFLSPWSTTYTGTLEQYCRDTVLTIWHYHGGCLVGKVVDYDYKVMGVDALRVIDGSTFELSPGTNPQATVMMLGRYMGIKMLRERHAYGIKK